MKELLRTLSFATAVIVLVAACMTSHDVIADKEWKLASIDGKAPVAAATLLLRTDGTLLVQAGCNGGGGPYGIDGNRIVTEAVGLSVMGCEEPIAAQEQAIQGLLEADPVFAVDTGTGQLRLEAGGVTLLFDAP
jgi:heat shock protein HslJ